MNKIKLLFISNDFSHNVNQNQVYFIQYLSQVCDLTVWNHSGNIHSILKQLTFDPDFILLDDFKPEYLPEITGLDTLTIPFGVIMHDLHYKADRRKKYIIKNNIRYIFSIYRDKFFQWYPELLDRFLWFPHFVNIDIFKDYYQEKTTDMLLMGAKRNKYYPLRMKILNTYKGKGNFKYIRHPGYKNNIDLNKTFVGEKFASEINRAKIFFTCDSIYKYPIKKYYEVLACNTLLLAPSSKELLDLGFIPNEHFVEIDENNFEEKALYYLFHEDERRKISRKGYDMVREKHSITQRISELIEMITEIINSSNKK